VAGVVLAGVLLAADIGDVELVTAIGYGLAYGFVLFVGAAVFWMNVVLGLDAERKEVGLFLFFHLVYGGVLGAVLGAGVV
jgi:hypothetical protein